MDFQPPARLHAAPFARHAAAGAPALARAAPAVGLLLPPQFTPLQLAVPLDHDAPHDGRVHTIRYWVSAESWSGRADAPICVSVPGESARDVPSPVPDWVRSRGGLGISLEHRFFGSSMPTADTSVANLQYLTVKQSMADIVKLVDHVKAERGLTGPVIATGCSYSGALAAWLRTRYPDRISASIAASAPVQTRVRFDGLDRSVSLALQRYSPSCLEKVRTMMISFDMHMEASSEGKRRIKEAFSMASDSSLSQGDFDLRYMLADSVASAVQGGSKRTLCTELEGIDPTTLSPVELAERWAVAAGLGRTRTFQRSYDSILLRNTSAYSQVKDQRLWTWLQCTQLGYLQVLDLCMSNLHPCGFSLSLNFVSFLRVLTTQLLIKPLLFTYLITPSCMAVRTR